MKIKEYPCCVCESSGFKQVYPSKYDLIKTADDYRVMMSASSDAPLIDALATCNQCGHLQTNPRLDDKEVLKGYETSVDPNHVKQDKYRGETFVRTVSHLDSLSELRATESTEVLDIGCASGSFLNSVKREFGWNGIGLEPSRWMCDFGKQAYGLDLRPRYFSATLFAAKSFQLVTLWDVLEHISEPNQVIRDVGIVLKDDGYLLINVPNSSSFASRIFGRKWPFLLAVHIHYFTQRSITMLLDKHDFEIVESRPYFQSLGLGYLFQRGRRILGRQVRDSAAISLLDRIPVRYNMGQTTFVARKKKSK